ncbi:leucine-rich repeat receptor-like protein kinase [Striga asiatica]|uniref:non-specific serine/threonine protein kinase n=1 Tax=Striga asiatica TaxID=4170 RepID=A0A5A7PYE5_STRAF|nr:leucine-rich repeat receptor-like protein kinase [Striga asiatica]
MLAAPPQRRPEERRPIMILRFAFTFGQLISIVGAQNQTNSATTNPSEARALNSIFHRWGLSASNQWNISGELCSGVATDQTQIANINPGIKCDCTDNNGSTCHVTALRVYALDVAGQLPDELWSLTFLTDLDLRQNYLTGPIPASIANLTRMQYLSFGINALSGQVPRELGLLTDLRSFCDLNHVIVIVCFVLWRAFGTNNFTGPLPPELGNLSRLTQMYFISSGISGPIPATFASLRSMERMWASDTELTGRIPDFIGNWSNLVQLDLSYNVLSGSFPSWVGEQNLQLNLVSNNFTITSSNSALPSGLNCLQMNFPCGRGNPTYSSFAINSGGPPIRSSDQLLFESDNETLGPAMYYVTASRRWAVSNVGLPLGSISPQYQYNSQSQSQFTNTQDSDLFRDARISAGSLRYYGLGLENGNYTVRLHFAEIVISSFRTWRNLGRRVFDIYIQGNLVQRDFDIRREAGGGFDLRTVTRDYRARVLENYLEIHLFWAGKGTCCVPAQGTYGPLISAISVTPGMQRDYNVLKINQLYFVPTVSNNPPGGNKNRTGLIIGIVVGASVLIIFVALGVFYIYRTKQMQRRKIEDQELLGIEKRTYTFSYSELRAATNDFSPDNKLGEGGFGPVYKGILADGRVVAVKQLSVASQQGKSQFVAEIETISTVQHRNLVKLYGYCIEGEKRLLVYEYLENKSLDRMLFGDGSKSLDWSTRYNICSGVAKGLAYLHEESRMRIVHRDVKASNILLDSELVPRISDFGLAKLYDDKMTHISTRVAGTIGYLAPEYAMFGQLTEKADIFSFGVLALETVSGKPNSESSLEDDTIYLLERAWNLHENKKELDLVDPNMHKYNENEVKRIIGISLLCTQASPALRPSMSRVVAMLSGEMEVPTVNTRPGYLTGWNFNDATISASGENVLGYSPENDAKAMLHERIDEGR